MLQRRNEATDPSRKALFSGKIFFSPGRHFIFNVTRPQTSPSITLRWPVIFAMVGLGRFQEETFSQAQLVVDRLRSEGTRYGGVDPPDRVTLDQPKSGKELPELGHHRLLSL